MRMGVSEVALRIALSTSPLPPASTISLLSDLRLIPSAKIVKKYLEDPDMVKEDEKKRLSKWLKAVIEEAREDSLAGKSIRIEKGLRRSLSRLELMPSLLEYHISQLFDITISLFTVVPTLLMSLVMIVDPRSVPLIMLLCSGLGTIVVVLLSILKVPNEIKYPRPPVLLQVGSALAVGVLPILYNLWGYEMIPIPIVVTSIASILCMLYKRRRDMEIEDAGECIDRAMKMPWNIPHAVGFEDPEEICSRLWWGLPLATSWTLVTTAFGGREAEKALKKLKRYYELLVSLIERIRGRAKLMFYYSIFNTLLCASCLAIVISIMGIFTKIPVGMSGLPMPLTFPTQDDIAICELSSIVLLCMISLALSISTASLIDFNYSYFPKYVPLLLGASILIFRITLVWMRKFMGL